MNYQSYLQSDRWKALRQEKLEACEHKCECEGGCSREATQIHHLHYDTFGHEDLQDLQALCAKCHMATSNVKDFYGRSIKDCCRKEGNDVVEKTLPYHVYHEANSHLIMNHPDQWKNGKKALDYQAIAMALGTEPVIVALLDNLGIMFGCGDIAVEDKVTAAIGEFVDVVPAEEAGLEGYCDVAYKIKPEFEKYFEKEDFDFETVG